MTDTARGKPERSEAGTVFFFFSGFFGVDCKHQVVVVPLDTPRLPATLSNTWAGGVWLCAGVQGKSLGDHLITSQTLDDHPPGSLGVPSHSRHHKLHLARAHLPFLVGIHLPTPRPMKILLTGDHTW